MTRKHKNRLFFILFIIALFLVLLFGEGSSTADVAKQTDSTCGTPTGNATVCFNNVVLNSDGVPPVVVTICPEPRSRVGIFTTCGGTLYIRAYDAPMFPEEITATAQAELTTTPKP